jgi:hypothetical protein
VYLKDYIIITDKMYELFKSWYICLGPDLPRYKIDKLIDKKPVTGNNKPSITKKLYELEAYPVFVKVLNMDDVIVKSQGASIDEVKEYLYNTSLQVGETGQVVLQQYSKYMLLKEMFKLIDNTNRARLWVYHDSKFFNPNLEKTFEEEGLSDFVVVVLEHQKGSKWISESFSSGGLSRRRTSIQSKSLVGITNLGNSKYTITFSMLYERSNAIFPKLHGYKKSLSRGEV